MEKKPIQAKNVVSFGDGKTVNRPNAPAPVAEPGFIKTEAVEEAAGEAEQKAEEAAAEVPAEG